MSRVRPMDLMRSNDCEEAEPAAWIFSCQSVTLTSGFTRPWKNIGRRNKIFIRLDGLITGTDKINILICNDKRVRKIGVLLCGGAIRISLESGENRWDRPGELSLRS